MELSMQSMIDETMFVSEEEELMEENCQIEILDRLTTMDQSILVLNRNYFDLKEAFQSMKSDLSKELSAMHTSVTLRQNRHNSSHLHMCTEISGQISRLKARMDARRAQLTEIMQFLVHGDVKKRERERQKEVLKAEESVRKRIAERNKAEQAKQIQAMQCTSYVPVYYHAKDLNVCANGFSWHLFNVDRNYMECRGTDVLLPSHTLEQYLGYDKDVLRQIIQNHESTFRFQVAELHRLYRKQMELMDEINSRGIFTQLRLQTLESNHYFVSISIQ